MLYNIWIWVRVSYQRTHKKNRNLTIYVFETNLCIFKQALFNVDLEDILSYAKLKIILEEDIFQFAIELNKALYIINKKLVIHQPSLRAIPKQFLDIRYSLEDYRMHNNTVNHFKSLMENNFEKNVRQRMKNADCLFGKFMDKTVFIISAGPSLSRNINKLKEVKGKGIILAVGTAVKPLLRSGIYPDLIIMTDPQDIVVNQIEGTEIDIPIIILATCNYKVAEVYNGPKMLALQNGVNMAEEYAKQNGNQLVRTGGSVATTALDVTIKLGCSKVVFVGQDLAYTNGKTHTEGTFFYEEIEDFTHLRKVEGINNTTVYTSPNLYIYRKWIEKRIEEESCIQFINATEGGALIKGTINMTLENVIDTKISDIDHCKYQGIINNIFKDKSY